MDEIDTVWQVALKESEVPIEFRSCLHAHGHLPLTTRWMQVFLYNYSLNLNCIARALFLGRTEKNPGDSGRPSGHKDGNGHALLLFIL